MTFEDESVLENFINQQQPMQYKVERVVGLFTAAIMTSVLLMQAKSRICFPN